MRETTDLKELRASEPFTWGKLRKIHEIAEYSIVEYHPWKIRNSTILTGQPALDLVEFSCYVDDKSCSRSAYSLDEALAICIAYKHEGVNFQAARYFMKMIKKEE